MNMTKEYILRMIEKGKKVYWHNERYEVILSVGELYVYCKGSEYMSPLTDNNLKDCYVIA